jgi:antitoxin (DNA-binding transcriptional repressor) of toxin-antitoxin stability system
MAATETVDVEEFEAQCLSFIDRIESREVERVIITRQGQPVAVLIPPEPGEDVPHGLFGAMRGSVTIPEGVDLTEPALDEPFSAEDIDPAPSRDRGRPA